MFTEQPMSETHERITLIIPYFQPECQRTVLIPKPEGGDRQRMYSTSKFDKAVEEALWDYGDEILRVHADMRSEDWDSYTLYALYPSGKHAGQLLMRHIYARMITEPFLYRLMAVHKAQKGADGRYRLIESDKFFTAKGFRELKEDVEEYAHELFREHPKECWKGWNLMACLDNDVYIELDLLEFGNDEEIMGPDGYTT